MTMMLNFTDEEKKRRNYNVHVNVEIEEKVI
jgi:hypothetical protein